MKLYKKFIILGIIIVLLFPTLGVNRRKNSEIELMMEILEKTDATFKEGDISLGGVILDRFVEKDEMLDFKDRIRNELGIKGILIDRKIVQGKELTGDYYWEEKIEEDGFNQIMVQGVDKKNNLVTFTLSSYSYEKDNSGETSLFINLISNNPFVENNDIMLKVEKIFDEYDKSMNVTSCIVGTINDNMNMGKNEDKILAATKTVNGKIIEQYKDDDTLSFSIFTPYIDEYIYTGENKMNLNIAMRFDEHENKTYILIGTPIITIGY
ncbi:YwmB family TATA-box binding protein [Schnuerera sp. xch1]|uniref:YwmB family TATA-box binding protein n=1 Tax=Schnuerera sp. xch1 TaxID=2874283 RepID=UPI001CBC6BAB|nr:YwmB family TATA-box binding protein [Schnuerera sp. xch1]MBZ2174913.1 YwmB family TATA-box binding protein [Schnuerera sp. xch1]